MKIVHLNTSNKGGAGIAALRLHERLLRKGIDSKFLSLHQFPSSIPEQYQFRSRDCSSFPIGTDLKEFTNRTLRKLNMGSRFPQDMEAEYLKGQAAGFDLFSFPYSEYQLQNHPLVKEADIVHLHWVSDGFLDFESFFSSISKKIVWTTHDMYPFTGGCHHSDGCMNFVTGCADCPQLKGTLDEKYSETIFQEKKRGFSRLKDVQMKIVSPSSWLTSLSAKSELFRRFRHFTIANPLNEKLFSVRSKTETRNKLKLPADKKIILFAAHNLANVRKGGHLLMEALKHLTSAPHLALCSVGSDTRNIHCELPHFPLGYVNSEEEMAELYAAADVFVLPSLAENFPNTICESLLCGTPVVAFNVGGIPELVNESNGKLATPFDTTELASAIRSVLDRTNDFQPEIISSAAHERLNSDHSTNKYISVYTELMNEHA